MGTLTYPQIEALRILNGDWQWWNRPGNCAAWSLCGKQMAERRFLRHPKGWLAAQFRLTARGIAAKAIVETQGNPGA